jgi:HEAT repeat protein
MRYHSVQDPVADTLQRILGNDPGALLMIEDLLEEQTVEFAGIVVRAVTRSHREGALRILERALGRDPELDARILGAVAEMSVRAPWTVGGDAAEVVRPYLGAKDWRLRQAAASAAGRMGDRESFSRVVLLLEDGNAAVRFAARRALVEMSGTSRFESTDDWLRWLDEQTTWWERNQDRLRAELESETPQVLLRAVRELTERALFRHEATAMLCELLRRPEPGVVATVCGVLAELDSATAVPELVAALDRREVPDGVHSALVAMTGEHLPADHQVWTDYLRGSDRGTQ